MKVLVTGAAGFIGSHLMQRLGGMGIEAIPVDLKPGAGILQADVTDFEAMDAMMRRGRPDAVIHLAALISPPESVREPLKYLNNNSMGTAATLEAARRNDVSLFIYMSSLAVYGEPKEVPLTEASPLNPINPYGASKVLGEEVVRAYHSTYGVHYLIFRPSNIYGIGQNPEYAGVITSFVKAITEGRRPVIYGDGLQTRDFISVKDVVDLLAKAAAGRAVVDGTFNIASGRSIGIRELLDIVASAAGRGTVEPVYEERRPGDIYRSEVSNRLACKAFNYAPKHELGLELRELLKWQGGGL